MPTLVKIEDMNGYHINPDCIRVKNVLAALQRSGGFCPCIPQPEWTQESKCPCVKYRTGEGCHCGLYTKETVIEVG